MRPGNCWTLLHVSVLAALLLSLNADSDECEIGVKRRPNIEHKVSLGDELRIYCTVTFCKNPPPTVSWVKLEQSDVPVNMSSRLSTEWKTTRDLIGDSILIFHKTVTNDSGEYRCQSGGSVGSKIKVSISDHARPNNTTEQTLINTSTPNPGGSGDMMMYVYTGAGIMGFVVIVIVISVVSMRGCKGTPKKATREDNQYAAISMAERPSQNLAPQPSPRGSPSVPLARGSTRRQKPPPQPNECVYSTLKDGVNQLRSTVQNEGGSVVYAALNHQVPARAPARPRRPKEESSEYAAIRIKDPNSS
ncbi:B- and T-lymphocyte attenuator-like [Halichoeres trimaculatus]|uniref:B- and T-lymphocyte attenuator-like n=1 Tax=Halichoeres trimaculatus TaxID=147232 RepID=UPI003D9F0B0B